MRKKTLQELTIKDNFMFGAVMMDEENCRMLLERILGFPIAKVEVKKEHSIVYHPEYKGVRLDIYAKDENNTHYNVEMQAVRKVALGKRARYYHGQIDMELLLSGKPYEELPDTYVIFICDFDPFGEERYYYSFGKFCKQNSNLELGDGVETIFLSTKGKNKSEVSTELVKFLEYVGADLIKSTEDFGDELVRRLQNSVQRVKVDREMEARHMLFEEVLREERQEGRQEGLSEAVLQLLQDLGVVSDELQRKIINEKDLETLKKWNKLAAKSESLEQFVEHMDA